MIGRYAQSLDRVAAWEYERRVSHQECTVTANSEVHMDIDGEKLEQVVLALLYLNSFEEGTGRRAWKSFPWSIMDSLHEKGYISEPANKNKSVWLSEKGAKLSEKLFEKLFAVK
jgi:hypothetical protein